MEVGTILQEKEGTSMEELERASRKAANIMAMCALTQEKTDAIVAQAGVVNALLGSVPFGLLSSLDSAFWDNLQVIMEQHGCGTKFSYRYNYTRNCIFTIVTCSLIAIFGCFSYAVTGVKKPIVGDAVEDMERIMYSALFTNYVIVLTTEFSVVTSFFLLAEMYNIYSVPSKLVCSDHNTRSADASGSIFGILSLAAVFAAILPHLTETNVKAQRLKPEAEAKMLRMLPFMPMFFFLVMATAFVVDYVVLYYVVHA